MRSIKLLLDLVYPRFCGICDSRLSLKDKHICTRCLSQINRNIPPFCAKCSRHISGKYPVCSECLNKSSYIKQMWSWGIYENTLKKCLHIVKYKRKKYILSLFTDLIVDFSRKYGITDHIDIITFVPLHESTLEVRAFNQAYLIAKAVAGGYKIPVIKLLDKTKSTTPQYNLTKRERTQNIKGAFKVRHISAIRQKRILIVDDIYTTGSTINECARMLHKRGARAIYGFTLARGA